ncbi:aldo/keto reductase, partial [Marinobacter sp.]
KIWTGDGDATRQQDRESRRKWGIERFDLQQVHNLVAWQQHLATLQQMKADGDVRYIGITTSHGRRHGDFARIMETEPLDFVQLTYNVLDREAEDRLLPLARERGIAVIANRPFQGGRLFRRFQSEALPPWADEVGCRNWAEFFLKYILSHPAVTCAIPATTSVEHMKENMGALYGALPDEKQRRRMAAYVAGL